MLVKNTLIPTLLPQIKEELPASLIQRRPDIQSLLLQVESKNYSVAESKRNLLPGIFFNGNIGTNDCNSKQRLGRFLVVYQDNMTKFIVLHMQNLNKRIEV
mgnify:CR=1 FL=1